MVVRIQVALAGNRPLHGTLSSPGGGQTVFSGWHELVGELERLRLEPSEPASAPMPATRSLGNLSRRELEVLEQVAAGWSDSAIGQRLGLSPRTVSAHVYNLLTKLEIPRGGLYHRRVVLACLYLDLQWAEMPCSDT